MYLHRATDETVLCIDEKTGMQALERKHSTRPPGPGRIARREFEYIRHGTRTLFAAFNPHTGDVFGQVSVNRSADTLVLFMERVAQQYPTGRVTIVWDNLNTHHGPRFSMDVPRRTPVQASCVIHADSRSMARQPLAEKMELDDVTEFLARRRKLARLRARKRGSFITLESGPLDDPVRHARLRRLSVNYWTLECATHTGRWEPTGEPDTLDALLKLLTTTYPWVPEPIV